MVEYSFTVGGMYSHLNCLQARTAFLVEQAVPKTETAACESCTGGALAGRPPSGAPTELKWNHLAVGSAPLARPP